MEEYIEALKERLRAQNQIQSKKYLDKIEALGLPQEDKDKVTEIFLQYLETQQKEGLEITPFDSEYNTLIEDIVTDLDRQDPESDSNIEGVDSAWLKPRPEEYNISKQNMARLKGRFRTK